MSRIAGLAVALYLVGCNVLSPAETTPFGSGGAEGTTGGPSTATTEAITSSPTTSTGAVEMSTSGDVPTSVPFDSILAALDHPLIETGVELNGPGGCSEGFLRDDALLLVVVIQDTYDQDSLGGPYQWAKALYAVKGGDEDAVSALVITSDADISPSLCFPGEPPSYAKNRLRLFGTDYLKHGKVESICAPSYGEFFEETAAQVAGLCDQFIPQ